jgi:uncharacterized membrane protein YdjX (TVP38/TMEM64 family)
VKTKMLDSMTTTAHRPTVSDRARAVAGKVKLVSLLVIAAALVILARDLPVQEGAERLRAWVEGLGFWAPATFAGIYALATVLMLPGAVLTLVAGAVFGLGTGFVTISVGSTAGAALAFLVARYLARERVARLARSSSRFGAFDAAVAEGGWKIVALLRLSPAVPFNLQNYLWGLSPVRFGTYLLTSWLAMMPGTFLYVYIGHVAGAAVGEPRARTAAEWAFLAAGLVATLIVTWYVTRLARGQLAARRALPEAEAVAAAPDEAVSEAPARGWPWGATVMALVALALAALAGYSAAQPRGLLGALSLGPPQPQMTESYERRPDGPRFDHSAFDRLVKAHVDPDGWIDYPGLAADQAALDAYLGAVAAAPFEALGRDEKLALLINAYNAATIKLILDYWPLDSIRDIPARRRWRDERWVVGGRTLSLDQIEHEQIRPHFIEPRIHFALVCAAGGCPPLRPEAFTGDRLEEQLEEQTRYVHSQATWLRWEPARGTLHLTPLYDWYGGDFEQVAGSVEAYVARYVPGLAEHDRVRIRWLDYDWAINDVSRRQPR